MKKSIQIALLLCVLQVKAQFTVTSVNPNQFKPGDSIHVKFLYKGATGQSNFVLSPSVGGGQIWQRENNSFYSLPKSLSGNDTIYTIGLKTSTMLGLGNADMNGYSVLIYEGSVGIKQYEMNQMDPVYYDTNGNMVERTYNSVLIQVIGNKRKKVYIIE